MQSSSDARLSGHYLALCTWLVLTVLNLELVKSIAGRRHLFSNQSRVQKVPEHWQDMYLMQLNFVYWPEGVCFFFFFKFQHFIDDYVGSVFILAIAAAADTRSTIRNYLTHDVVIRINYLLRCPNSGKCPPSKQLTRLSNEFLDHVLGKLIIEDIIPVIDILRRKYRATFSSMFNQELLFSRGVIPEVEAGDLLRSDEFFDSITYK